MERGKEIDAKTDRVLIRITQKYPETENCPLTNMARRAADKNRVLLPE
jgi:hypothetical protein